MITQAFCSGSGNVIPMWNLLSYIPNLLLRLSKAVEIFVGRFSLLRMCNGALLSNNDLGYLHLPERRFHG